MNRLRPACEQLESRSAPSLVFVLNGNAFAPARPDPRITGTAALQLIKHGDRAIQLATPAMTSPGSFYQIASQILSLSHGQPIGLMGFSAGGGLAMRLSAIPSLNVRAVLSYYGPPDLRDWMTFHHGDRDYQHVTSRVQFSPAIIDLLSGLSSSTAFIVSAFGIYDSNIVASVSTASFDRDFHFGEVFYYPGRHAVTMFADYPAFREFLAHLPA
jgi:hypothetical protein